LFFKYTNHKKHVIDAELELQIAIDRIATDGVTAAATGTAAIAIDIVEIRGMISFIFFVEHFQM
jgi:hypothetical protein